MSSGDFNLWDEPWIEVIALDGTAHELSILDTFRQAPQLRRVVGELPTQGFATLRVLLAILGCAVDGPYDKKEWRGLAGSPPPMDRIEAYREKYHDRFYLFHPETPFFQVAGLHTAKGEFSGLEKLIAEVPAGHPYFTTRVGPGVERLGPAEAARWVIHAQAFDCSGIKSGAVDDPRVKGGKGYPIGTGWAGRLGGVYVEGDDLWQTLLLNTIPLDVPEQSNPLDRPAWEATPSGPTEAEDVAKRPYGPWDLFTWQSRRILLAGDTTGVTGVVLANGDKLAPPYRHEVEPMTAWRRSVPQQKKLKMDLVYMPLEHRPERAFWRGLQAMLPAPSPTSRAKEGQDFVTARVFEWAATVLHQLPGKSAARVRLRAVGMEYGPQSATFTNLVDDGLVVSPDVLLGSGSELPQLVIDAVNTTEEAVRALRYLASNLVQAAGGSDDKIVAGARDDASVRAYAALDRPFREWLAGLEPGTEPETARTTWYTEAARIVRGLGGGLVAASGPAALVGREVQGRLVCSPIADGWFHSALLKALPVPKTHTSTPSTDSTTQGESA